MATSAKASSQQFSALTWNIEGIKRNTFLLAEVLKTKDISLAFLSETQAYQCDLSNIAQYIEHDYCYSLNSDDISDPELPLLRSNAKGGTMILWKKCLDPYIKVINVLSTSFLPIVLTLPGSRPTNHDTEFVSEKLP